MSSVTIRSVLTASNTLRRGILERANEEQQAAKFIIDALLRITAIRLDDKRISAPHVGQWTGFMLTILKLSFLVIIWRDAKMCADP